MSFVIEKETESLCTSCGKVAELRPYGENGAEICFSCAMKNEKRTRQIFEMLINPPKEKMLS